MSQIKEYTIRFWKEWLQRNWGHRLDSSTHDKIEADGVEKIKEDPHYWHETSMSKLFDEVAPSPLP